MSRLIENEMYIKVTTTETLEKSCDTIRILRIKELDMPNSMTVFYQIWSRTK